LRWIEPIANTAEAANATLRYLSVLFMLFLSGG
jgi:hypothetical protein